MRRLARMLLDMMTVLCVLLALGLIVVFLTVDFAGDQPKRWQWQESDGRRNYVLLAADKIEWDHRFPVGSGIITSAVQFGPLRRFVHWNGWVLEYSNGGYYEPLGSGNRTLASHRVVLNTGPLFLLSLVLPVARGVKLYWKSRPLHPGRCRTCGYDLRATPDRCPECGTPRAAGAHGDASARQ